MKNIILFKTLVGSNNYNLATPESDKDYKVFLLPTFEDLYSNKYIKAGSIKSETEDLDFYDIRELTNVLYKSNINFIEVLFSNEIIIPENLPGWAKIYVQDIFKLKEDIARMNLPYLYNACMGMAFNKMKLLDKGTESSKHLIEKHGYDTKAFMTAYRVLDFLERYADNGFTDFRAAINYEDPSYLRFLRSGKLTKEEAIHRNELKEARIKTNYESIYKSKEVNANTLTKLEHVIKRLIYKSLLKTNM